MIFMIEQRSEKNKRHHLRQKPLELRVCRCMTALSGSSVSLKQLRLAGRHKRLEQVSAIVSDAVLQSRQYVSDKGLTRHEPHRGQPQLIPGRLSWVSVLGLRSILLCSRPATATPQSAATFDIITIITIKPLAHGLQTSANLVQVLGFL